MEGQGGANEPSSFLRTRSMAPEHPPQLMATSNLYVWDMVSVFEMGERGQL